MAKFSKLGKAGASYILVDFSFETLFSLGPIAGVRENCVK